MPEAARALGALLAEIGAGPTTLSPLLAHARAVVKDADRLGLVSERRLEDVLARHTADSLLFALVRPPLARERWGDIGSGAGFPGLVLACTFPQTTFTLVEPQRRRVAFLEMQAATLGLGNVEVLPTRLESLTVRFDVAVARAFRDPSSVAELLVRVADEIVLAAGPSAEVPTGARELAVPRPGVDSAGRLFIIAQSAGEERGEHD